MSRCQCCPLKFKKGQDKETEYAIEGKIAYDDPRFATLLSSDYVPNPTI